MLRAGDGADPLVALLPPDERVRVAGDGIAGAGDYAGRAELARFAALAPADRVRLVERLGIDLSQRWYLRLLANRVRRSAAPPRPSWSAGCCARCCPPRWTSGWSG